MSYLFEENPCIHGLAERDCTKCSEDIQNPTYVFLYVFLGLIAAGCVAYLYHLILDL